MVSIITAIHNCLDHNQIFLDSLRRYSYHPHELIIIDNASRDGSPELFKRAGCRIIRNEKNLCYPEAMNQGIAAAKGEFICLLNNDVFVGVQWDKNLIDAMEMYRLDVVSPCGIERMPTLPLTHLFFKRWRSIGEKKHQMAAAEKLRGLLKNMYGSWETFCQRVKSRYYPKIMEGIVGNCVLLKRSALEKIGPLDETIQAQDWDLYLTVRKKEEGGEGIHRVMTVCWSYVHHFIRTTLKSHPAPFSCVHPKRTIEEKWDRETIQRLWPFPYEVRKRPSPLREPISYWHYKREKMKSLLARTEDENQWIQFWKELDRT